MPATPGTLYEYDMILSVSQKAINNQFLVLFNTPDPTSTEDDPPNLIPNVMKLGYLYSCHIFQIGAMAADDFFRYLNEDTGEWEPCDRGVTADINCPTVDLTDTGPGGIALRSVRLKIHMKTATLTYFDPNTGARKEKNLDGYTVSWVAQIGRRDIQNIEEEAMHPNAKKSIKEALKKVPSEDFIPSSLFCLFESTVVVNSFTLTNANGEPVTDSVTEAFLIHLTTTFKNIDHKDYPYVLGYGISQKIPNPLPDSVEAAFLPSMFTFSTTPYEEDQGKQATLNFCMMGANSDINENLIDPNKNPAAGVLDQPFTYLTRAANLKSDGVFAASNTLLSRQWLYKIIFDKMDVGPDLAYQSGASCSDPVYTGGCGSRKASKSTYWEGPSIDPGFLLPSYKLSGTSKIDVDYSSKLQDQPSGEIPVGAKRNLTLKLNGTIDTKIDFGNFWGYMDATSKWNAELVVSSANDGKWSVEMTEWNTSGPDKHDHLTTAGDILDLVTSIFLGGNGVLGILVSLLTQLGLMPTANFDKIGTALETVSSVIIMPSGDVYTYQGVDCDENGNVYSHIKYKTI